MRPTLILLRKSLRVFRRAKAAVIITFVVPITLIYLFGHVFGLYRKDSGPSGIPVAVVDASGDPAALDLINALRAEKALAVIADTAGADGSRRALTEADVRAGLHDNQYRFALILPADLISSARLGLHVKFLSNPRNEIEAQMVNGLLQKTIFTKVPQLLGRSLQQRARDVIGPQRLEQFNEGLASSVSSAFGGDKETIKRQIASGDLFPSSASSTAPADQPAKADGAADVLSRIVRIETEQVAGKDVKNPMAARIVGGYAIMFLLFAVSGSATAMFEERESGVFQRLLSSPVRPAHILWARYLFGIILGLVQISALFLAGRLFFGLDIFSHAGALFAVALAAAAACSAFGMLIAAFAPSAPAAQGLATFLVISMSAVGGAWFPVSFMPDYIQVVSKLTLVYWSVEGFTDVLWAGRSLLEVLPKIGILAGMSAAVLAVSLWRFGRSRMFE
ncbi:ABC transporter permease [Opitutus terrae]|uniref:ABC-2 type transporter n=1 Tax=Opitutus terrae (strain DSM 11246 / JCM 15787 / PB90-1) TaxID=452637 RepID=B1ZM95_OPITP|nr:ABC transporter permease [Opitutus terrae]ACB73348.1 ABC-2 type transporter [Opitutus terrae PB90-1]